MHARVHHPTVYERTEAPETDEETEEMVSLDIQKENTMADKEETFRKEVLQIYDQSVCLCGTDRIERLIT